MSGLQKNVAGQKWRVFAFNKTNNEPVTGDAANITAKIAKDWGAATATNDVNPTETEDGYYLFDLTQAETDANALDLYPESSTANVQVIGSPATQGTVPVGFADGVSVPSIGGTPSMNDQKKGETTRLWFNTKDKAGDLISPTVNGSVYVLEADGAAQITAGVTVSYNVSQNGVHRVDIDTTNDEYEAEKDYTVIADGMTIDTVAGLSRTVGQFTVRAASIDDVFGSGYVDAKWRWDTDTTETDPGTGEIKVNNANYALATECYISAETDRGDNATLILASLEAGDALLIARSTDPTGKFIVANITGAAVDNTGWFTIPISVADTNGTFGAGNVADVGFRFAPQVQPFDETDAAQVRYRLQMSSGSQEAPASDAPTQLEVTADTVTNPVTVGTNNDKTGYNVTSGTVDDVTNPVTVGTNNDKTGYSLAADITVKKGVALPQFQFQMVDTSDVPATGLTVTGQIVKDTGGLASLTNGIAEIGNGLYRVNGGLTASETNADNFTLQFTAPGAKTLAVSVLTQAE